MNPNLYPTPQFVPRDLVMFYEYQDSHERVPIIAAVESAIWDEQYENWRYRLTGLHMAMLESKLAPYSKGFLVSRPTPTK